MQNRITSFADFYAGLKTAGFSMGGGNSEGIYSIISWSWNEAPPYPTPVCWHTSDAKTDPWVWRIRVLEECDDIAYAKLFFNKSGYITKAWYPCFLAVRRGGRSLAQAYADGAVSHTAKAIYALVEEHGALPLHEIKRLGGFGKDDKSRFDRALTELQMRMFLTVCGASQKRAKSGEEYGWSSTMFCTVEAFWGGEMLERAGAFSPEEARARIAEQVYRLNPNAQEKKVMKFIGAQ